MKKIPYILILLISLNFGGCSLFIGSDGEDGQTFLSIDWIDQPEYYTDDNPSIAINFERGAEYETEPGSYNFEYGYSDGFGWSGIYIIEEAEPGENGSALWKDGADGQHLFYRMLLSYNGSSFNNEYHSKTIQKKDSFYKITVFAEAISWDTSKAIKLNKLRQ